MAHYSSIKLNERLQNDLNDLTNLFIEKFARISSFTEEEKRAASKYAFVSNIGASTRIENAVLTNPEILWIDTVLSKEGKVSDFQKYSEQIKNKLSKDRKRSIEEVAGCRYMLQIINVSHLQMTPMTEKDIRELHSGLLKYYPAANYYRGQYKILPNSVIENNPSLNESHVVFETAPAGPITKTAMSDLISWYNEMYKTDIHPLMLATEFMYRFLAIHPFQDGNGRLGRGLFLLVLLQSKNKAISNVAKYIAIDRQIEQHKEEYYFELNRTSAGKYKAEPKKYNMHYILEYMIKMIRRSLDDIDVYYYRWKEESSLSESALRVFECFKEFPEKRLNTKHIIEETKVPRRTVINALNTLLEKKLIQKQGQGASIKYQLIF